MTPIRTAACALLACAALAHAQSSGPTQRGFLAKVFNDEELRAQGLLPANWTFDVRGGVDANGRLGSYVIQLEGPGGERILLQRYEGRVRAEANVLYATQAEPVERRLLRNTASKLHEVLSVRRGETFHCRGWAVAVHRDGAVQHSLLLDGIQARLDDTTAWVVDSADGRMSLRKGKQVRTAPDKDVHLVRYLGVPHELASQATEERALPTQGLTDKLATLKAAKAKQAEAACAHHLRNIALGAIMYGDDKRFFPSVAGDDGKLAIQLLVQNGYLDESQELRCPLGGRFAGFMIPYEARKITSLAPVVWCPAHVDEDGKHFVLLARGDASTTRVYGDELQQALKHHAARHAR